jgi:hypothetical protein
MHLRKNNVGKKAVVIARSNRFSEKIAKWNKKRNNVGSNIHGRRDPSVERK